MLPNGEFADSGFAALGVYDLPEFGGNGDRVLSPKDLIWEPLRIWVDANHDGLSQRREIRPLNAHGVVSIDLQYREVDNVDGHLNLHLLRGSFVAMVRAFGGMHLREQVVEDIFFISREAVESR